MLAEKAVFNILSALAPTHFNVAPEGSLLPRIVIQQVGGSEVTYQENTLSDIDNARIQVACWARSKAESAMLAKMVKNTLIQSGAVQARPLAARTSEFEEDANLYGTRQDFTVWSKDYPE